jgi:hypothetical protein
MPEEVSKEIIKDYEKLAEENIKDSSSNGVSGEAYKKAVGKVAKILASTLPPVLLTACTACEKPPVVEEQEEKPTAEVPSETIQENKEETKETPPVVEEETPEDSALETILKEKVSFISEALPGAELNTKTGELTAKVGNEWGIKEGESIGWYVVNAFTMETADGVEEEQDAVGLIPTVIEAMQNKIFEEKREKPFPIPINLKETEDIKITELKINSGMLTGVLSFGISVPIGSIIYSPLSGDYSFFQVTEASKVKTEDKGLGYGYWDEDVSEWEWSAQYEVNFVEGNIIPDEKTKAIPIENDQEILINGYEAKLGDPLIEITGLNFLDQTSNKIDDVWYFYENPGDYQLNLLHFKNLYKDGEVISRKLVDFLGLKTNQESEDIKIFILPNKPAYEQTK